MEYLLIALYNAEFSCLGGGCSKSHTDIRRDVCCPDCLLYPVGIDGLEDILVHLRLDRCGCCEGISPVALDLLLPGCHKDLVDLALDEFNALINSSHLPGDVVLFCLEGFLPVLLCLEPSTKQVNAVPGEQFLETGDVFLHLFRFLGDLTLSLNVEILKGVDCLVKIYQDLIQFFVIHFCIKIKG